MTKTIKIDNFIGGEGLNLSKKYFELENEFFEDFKVEIANSSSLDISIAISNAKKSFEECQNIKISERINIIKKVSNSIKFTDDEILNIVKIIGMPKKYIYLQIKQIKEIFTEFPKLILDKYGFKYNEIGIDFLENKNTHKIEFRIPKKGFVYAITPGNDLRITAIIIMILVLLGIPCIIKPSKKDCIIPNKLIEKVVEYGYPKNGISTIYFDSEKSESKVKNFKICDEASIIWVFGDENTVDNLLRLEKHKVIDVEKLEQDNFLKNIQLDVNKLNNSLQNYVSEQIIDHFNSKIILRHGSGRCSGVLDENYDLESATKMILKSSLTYPIGCNSMKSLYIVGSSYEKMVKILEKEFKNLDKKTSTPINNRTEIGYIDEKTINFLEKRLKELETMGLIKIIHGGKKINKTQMTPLLISTNDLNSELLINEISAYLLCIIKVNSFEEAILQINSITKNNPKLAVSYFTNNFKHAKMYVNAHHIKINSPTIDIDGIIHEGNDYINQLTRPYIVQINKNFKNPYRDV